MLPNPEARLYEPPLKPAFSPPAGGPDESWPALGAKPKRPSAASTFIGGDWHQAKKARQKLFLHHLSSCPTQKEILSLPCMWNPRRRGTGVPATQIKHRHIIVCCDRESPISLQAPLGPLGALFDPLSSLIRQQYHRIIKNWF